MHEHTWTCYGTTRNKSFRNNIFDICFSGSPHNSQLIVIRDGIIAHVKRINDVFKMIWSYLKSNFIGSIFQTSTIPGFSRNNLEIFLLFFKWPSFIWFKPPNTWLTNTFSLSLIWSAISPKRIEESNLCPFIFPGFYCYYKILWFFKDWKSFSHFSISYGNREFKVIFTFEVFFR